MADENNRGDGAPPVKRPAPAGFDYVARPTPIAPGAVKVLRAPIRDLFDLKNATADAVTFLDVRAGQCRWPLGEVGSDEFRFCGCPATHGSYCAAHHTISVDSNQRRRIAQDSYAATRIARRTTGPVLMDDWS